MTIHFKTSKLAKTMSEEKRLVREYGCDMADKIKQRLMELSAADSLALVSHLPPPRCHELTGALKGVFSVNVSAKDRLLFRPFGEFIRKPDGGIDLATVKEIQVLEVRDTHE